MENKISIIDQQLVVEPQGLDKMWSLKNKLSIPLAHVLGASIDEGILNEAKGIRVGGTAVPGYWAGTFKKDGDRLFYNIKQSSQPIVIQLRDEKDNRLILGTENPRALVDAINNQL